MIIENAIYDLDELARYNLHIHTAYSACAKTEMEMHSIIEHAQKYNLEMIAITDHHVCGAEIVKNNKQLREQALRCHPRCKILYGAELSAYGVDKYSDTFEINTKLDYRLYSYNHYHLDWWEHPQDKSLRGYVDQALDVLVHLFKSGRADCIAHPFIGRFLGHLEDKTLVTSEIQDKELGDILEMGKCSKVAWEINVGGIFMDPAFSKRYWNIGKEVGAVFHLGTDAHALCNIDTRQYLKQLKSILS